MAYYDALRTEWATLSGSTADKLAEINALTIPGPAQDVTVRSVVGMLLLNGAYLRASNFAKSTPTGDATHDAALVAMQTLMAWLTVPNAPDVQMSNPTTFGAVKAMGDAALAQELASPNSTGFTQPVHDALLALAATTIPWWQSAGYTSPINQNDLEAAGGLA